MYDKETIANILIRAFAVVCICAVIISFVRFNTIQATYCAVGEEVELSILYSTTTQVVNQNGVVLTEDQVAKFGGVDQIAKVIESQHSGCTWCDKSTAKYFIDSTGNIEAWIEDGDYPQVKIYSSTEQISPSQVVLKNPLDIRTAPQYDQARTEYSVLHLITTLGVAIIMFAGVLWFIHTF